MLEVDDKWKCRREAGGMKIEDVQLWRPSGCFACFLKLFKIISLQNTIFFSPNTKML
jgi:hypothetical protein